MSAGGVTVAWVCGNELARPVAPRCLLLTTAGNAGDRDLSRASSRAFAGLTLDLPRLLPLIC